MLEAEQGYWSVLSGGFSPWHSTHEWKLSDLSLWIEPTAILGLVRWKGSYFPELEWYPPQKVFEQLFFCIKLSSAEVRWVIVIVVCVCVCIFLPKFFDVSELPLAASAHPLQQAGCWVSHWAAVFSHAVFLYSLWMLSVGTWRLSVDEWVLWSRWDGNRDVIDIQSDPSEQLFGTNGLRHAHFLKAGLFSLTWPRVTAPSPEISSDLIYGVWIPAACYLGHRPMWCSMWGAQTKQQL